MPPRKQKLTSMDDIARLAKVSKPTVSRVFKDSPLISPQTKKRVLDIARGHGYSVNWNARKLRTNRSNTIAVVMHLPPQASETDPTDTFRTLWSSGLALILRGFARQARRTMDPGLVALAEFGEAVEHLPYLERFRPIAPSCSNTRTA